MDIQIQTTPPKRTINYQDFSTPPKKKKTQVGQFCTPQKKMKGEDVESTPVKLPLTHAKGQNPESKKLKSFGTNRKSPASSGRKITEFHISRLQMDYIYEKTLGKGNFSQVGLYRSRMTQDTFAIKETKASMMSVNEAQALGTLSIFSQKTKNIVRYFHSWVENGHLYLVMEYCSHNLASIYNRHRLNGSRIQQAQIKDYLKQSLQGLKSMHENKMVHLDIKPDNILFKEAVLKISDLGLTRVTKLKNDGDLEEGDSRYLAKQLLNYYPGLDTTKADIFSLGLTIYQGLSLDELPNNGQEWQNYRENGLHLKDRMDLQMYAQDLLQIVEAMTHPDWTRRPTAEVILQAKYFHDPSKKRNRLFLDRNERNRQPKKVRESSL